MMELSDNVQQQLYQLTAHSDIERQDDKSPNDTQTQTIVYGKDSKPMPCPFCGGTNICTEKGINLNYCDSCSAEANIEHWNARPIEDELRARIAELEEENARLVNTPVVDETRALAKRVFELEEEVTKYKDIRGEKMTDQLLVSRLDPFELLHEIEQLQHHITVLEDERRWIPVSEKPLEAGSFFVLLKNGDIRKDWTFIDGGRYYWWNSGDNVTHYMPLPQPPEVQE